MDKENIIREGNFQALFSEKKEEESSPSIKEIDKRMDEQPEGDNQIEPTSEDKKAKEIKFLGNKRQLPHEENKIEKPNKKKKNSKEAQKKDKQEESKESENTPSIICLNNSNSQNSENMRKYDVSISLEASNNPEEVKKSEKAEKLVETEEKKEPREYSNIDEEETEIIVDILNLIQLNKENKNRKEYLLGVRRLLKRLKAIIDYLKKNGSNNRRMKDSSLIIRRLTIENALFITNCDEQKKSIRFLFDLKMKRWKEIQEIRFENASTEASSQNYD